MYWICGVAFFERVGRGGEGARPLLAVLLDVADRDVAQRHLEVGEVDQVVAAAGLLEQLAEVLERRPCVTGERAQLGQEGPQLLGDGLGVVHQRLEVVERRAQVQEGGVGAAHEGRQPLDGLGQRLLLGPDRVGRGGEVVDQAGDVLAAVGEVGDELGGGDDEALEQLGVGVQLAEQAGGGRQRGVEVEQAGVHLLAAVGVLGVEALDQALEVLAGGLVEGVEDLVEVDRGGGRLLLDRAAVGDRRLACAREPEVDVAVGDAGQGGLADRREGALAQRRVVVVDAEGQLGLAVGRDADVLDLARRHAGDLDEVAAHELRGVLEARLDLVLLAGPAQEQHRDHRDGCGECDERDEAREWSCSSQVPPDPFPEAPTSARTETCGNV